MVGIFYGIALGVYARCDDLKRRLERENQTEYRRYYSRGGLRKVNRENERS